MPSVESVTLLNYKGFSRTRIGLGDTNVLVGANNAGKSTVVGGLRLAAAALPLARSRGPNAYLLRGGGRVAGWTLSDAAAEAAAFSSENVRHDFRFNEARIEVRFVGGALLAVTWPEADADEDLRDAPAPVLTVDAPPGSTAGPRLVAQTVVPRIGVVPGLTPIDDREPLVRPETLRRNLTSRRTSRYFRNALWAVRQEGEWQSLEEHLLDATPEIAGLSVELRSEVRPELIWRCCLSRGQC